MHDSFERMINLYILIDQKRKKIIIILLFFLIALLLLIFIKSTNNELAVYGTGSFRIIVDPGHGSIDTGTHFNGLYEKDINLKLARILTVKLKENNIRTAMTRNEDQLYKDSRNKDLKRRPTLTGKLKTDLFISLHVNQYHTSQPSGSQIFYKTNSDKSKLLAKTILKYLIKIRPENDREITPGNYYVLNQADCPAVLIEIGFISSPIDRQLLTDNKYLEKMANAITAGIIEYLKTNFYN